MKEIVKAFAAGVALPAFLMPFLLCIMGSYGFEQVSQKPFFHFLPLAWGVWNVLAIRMRPDAPAFVVGLVLGLLVAVWGVFVSKLPEGFGIPIIAPLVGAPLVYGIVWHFIVAPLNRLMDLPKA